MPVAKSRSHHDLSKSDFVTKEALLLSASIANWRKGAGFTQDKVADDIGISKALLSAIETSRTRPSYEVLVMLRKAMGKPSLAI